MSDMKFMIPYELSQEAEDERQKAARQRIEPRLEELCKGIVGKTGEHVLVNGVTEDIKEGALPYPVGGGINIKHRWMRLGVLNDDFALEPSDEGVLIPACKHVSVGSSFRGIDSYSEWKLHEGPICIEWTLVEGIGRKLPNRGMNACEGDGGHAARKSRVSIYAGNEEVGLFFRTQPYQYDLFDDRLAKRRAGEYTDEHWPKIVQLTCSSELNMWYPLGLKLLGVEVPDTFREEYDRQVSDAKAEIYATLEMTLIGSDKPNHNEVWRHLKGAVRLGMHEEPCTRELASGVTMDVPTYVRRLCEEHNVRIPDKKD